MSDVVRACRRGWPEDPGSSLRCGRRDSGCATSWWWACRAWVPAGVSGRFGLAGGGGSVADHVIHMEEPEWYDSEEQDLYPAPDAPAHPIAGDQLCPGPVSGDGFAGLLHRRRREPEAAFGGR